ncbi:uncharacterized protein [Dermacentor andersoni]|uniref:uncharacterized protein n=1 Tax=Dermacentor andersoni TaxID=34620 RepID=UPI002416B2A7|nr:uncharacterized protein LOC126542194 [Dermacentor andersoni]XP_054933043.1 uncharacterized protein LOC126542194 [Dermacentor andersoni]
MQQAQDGRSPSPNYDGLSSTDNLLPDRRHSQRAAPWSARIYRLIGSPNTAGKEELVVIGLLAFMLLAGVIVGAAMLPKDSEHGRMAALKVKYNIPSGYVMTTTTTTTTKNAATTKTRDHKPPNQKVAAKRAEEDHETDDAEETTTPTVEEQNESDSKKQGKARRKPTTINKSARTPKRHAEAPV